MSTISPSEIFRNRSIFFIGGTGFLGKVTLSMLLHHFPEVGKVYLMVRAGSSQDSEDRFWTNIFPSPAFDPVRKKYGSRVKEYLSEKLTIVGGDITHKNLGYTEEQAQEIAQNIDLVLNSSGNVSFNPPLETALKTNVTGTQNLIEFVKRMKRPAFVHTSTCFVAGNRSGQIWEEDPVVDYFPRHQELEDAHFSVAQELKDCDRLIRSVVEEATDSTLNAEFRAIARKRLIEEGRDPDEESTLNLAAARERKDWIRNRMSDLGLQRAQWWGWPNIYTYTKSMAEQMIAAETGIARAIVRPAIVESSVNYPFSGWNEGFNTTAPLILFALNGQFEFPVNKNLVLDIVPVDFVASAMLSIAAQTIVEEPDLVYQLCCGDVNPARMRRIVTLLGLYKRKYFQDKETGNQFLNALASRMEARPIEDDYFRKVVPFLHKTSKKAIELLDKAKSYGTFSGLLQSIKKGAKHLEAFIQEGLEAYEQFRPFMVLNEYQFRADHVRALFARISAEDRKILSWAPESIDWYHYWIKIHFPGLKKWVFPKMEEIGRPKPKRVYTYRNLMELFHAVTKLHENRIAMRMERKGELEKYTYADLQELVTRSATFLLSEGISTEHRVGLLSENCPEWGISYFGILKAGGTAIPLDKDLTTDEIANLLVAGKAKGLILSKKYLRKHDGLPEKLKQMDHDVSIWTFDIVYQLQEEKTEKEIAAKLPKAKPTAIASLIFTSGTTGRPKGVMLTHKNLSSMMAQLLKVYDVTAEDGFLSVLPLHHTFEFSTGFLLPISRGAQITYLEELNSDSISKGLKEGHVTIMVGVPALWDLLRRRILKKFGDKSEKLEGFVKGLISLNKWIREKSSLNLGPFLFFPVHHGLGGKIRYLISGGSALSEKSYETFYGLGFSMNEGYGLTEASPVLTVTRPDAKPHVGSVGEALPGVEIKILHPNEQGIGQVIARGPNVMAGYYQNKEATEATIIDGWLHTGDLGYVDPAGNLFLVGRSKDLIVGSSGKNVYPDELEDLYKHHDLIKEISIVGLPDEDGERIACIVVPDYEFDEKLLRSRVHTKIEEHFREVSSGLPVYKRVQWLQFYDEDLPRTGTRKVKRREIISILQKRIAETGPDRRAFTDVPSSDWLTTLVSQVCGRPVSNIQDNTTFDELGFDSLMYNELGAAIEASGRKIPATANLSGITNLKELAEFLHTGSRAVVSAERQSRSLKKKEDVELPSILQDAGSLGLDVIQKIFYKKVMDVRVEGKGNIPVHTNFIVAPNHCSHLDMGLVKTAMDEAGKNLAAVAAADYFFDNKYKRAFFDNFTNLIPMERKGSLRESLQLAHDHLHHGYNLLLFPEGTRSITGEIQEFKSSLGYLALRTGKGILPVYLSGTYAAMPKGSSRIKSRKLGVRFGPFLSHELLEKLTKGMPRNDAYRLITAVAQRIVERMKQGLDPAIDLNSIRRQWTREQHPQIEATPVTGD